MKNKLSDLITVIVFCTFLGVMAILLFILPKNDFSELEKRYLADFPSFSWESLSTGEFGEDLETYMADHLPGRDFFVGLNAYVDKFTGRQISKDIYTADDRLVESPVQWNEALAKKNMDAINAFSQTVGKKVDLMIVPSAGWAVQDQVDGISDPYLDESYIDQLHAMAADQVDAMDILSMYAEDDLQKLYYKTDHHWTSYGAYKAYEAYAQKKGVSYRPAEEFSVQTVPGFKGSTYSRSALWLTEGEELQMWQGSDSLIVTNAEASQEHAGVFYLERLEEADKYTVFLDGNHSLVRVENPDAEGKLLVIRDSYANCLGGFLAESYGTVVLADLRYYKDSLSELCEREAFDHILVCYSLGNFLTDTNLVWLR